MADAENTVLVDGVEPSILVRLLDIADNPAAVKVYEDRELVKGEDPVLLTPEDLGILGAFGIEIINKDSHINVHESKSEQAALNVPSDSEVVKLSPTNIGQSSPQV